jgi:hypothetical protein
MIGMPVPMRGPLQRNSDAERTIFEPGGKLLKYGNLRARPVPDDDIFRPGSQP